MINQQRLIKLTQRLLSIESENPPGNEYRIAIFVAKFLKDVGLQVKSYEFAKRRPNIVAVLKGENSKRSLLLSPHIDTVPAGRGWRFDPYKAKIYKGRIYGRGASDCKGNLAVGLEVIKSLAEDKIKLRNDIIFAATADEETGSYFGLIPLIKKNILRPKAAVILDADGSDIIVAQKGLIHFKLSIFGKKAHGAYPERGINAIDIAAKIILKLKNHKFKFKKHEFLKPPTINIGMINGGDKVNMVADWCEVMIDLRFLPGMKPKVLLDAIKKIARQEAKSFKIDIEAIQEPSEMDKRHYLVERLLKANKKFSKNAIIKGSEGATVMSWFIDKNIPTIATGYGQKGTAHATNEYVKINDLYKGARILEEFVKLYDRYEAK
ncbi:MAG: M20 family metallopeptidase [Candidatus Omnitrophica bacterium]|nr:M20 family metallopeptidase [Candidatus Omnitrophota bacterium]HOX53865.1 M20 family metallopeptidase [Candidatus Omnitrophota bacterium]